MSWGNETSQIIHYPSFVYILRAIGSHKNEMYPISDEYVLSVMLYMRVEPVGCIPNVSR
jgi:hypothetical protein